MKNRLAVFVLAVAGGMLGANVQPILTGTGKLLFPEASPSAELSASSGALWIRAGGTNQGITLAPTGTGGVTVGTANATGILNTYSSLAAFVDRAGANASHVLIRSAKGTVGTPATLTLNDVVGRLSFQGYDGTSWASGTNTGLYAVASENWTNAAHGAGLRLATTPNGSISATDRLYILEGGKAGLGASPAYDWDVVGDTNTSGVYRVGGVAGVSGSISVNTTTTSAVTGVSAPTGSAVTSISAPTLLGCVGLSLTTQTIQYKDWASANQSATVVTNVTCTANPFVTGVTPSTGSFVTGVTPTTATVLTGASASSNTFTGGIRTN